MTVCFLSLLTVSDFHHNWPEVVLPWCTHNLLSGLCTIENSWEVLAVSRDWLWTNHVKVFGSDRFHFVTNHDVKPTAATDLTLLPVCFCLFLTLSFPPDSQPLLSSTTLTFSWLATTVLFAVIFLYVFPDPIEWPFGTSLFIYWFTCTTLFSPFTVSDYCSLLSEVLKKLWVSAHQQSQLSVCSQAWTGAVLGVQSGFSFP